MKGDLLLVPCESAISLSTSGLASFFNEEVEEGGSPLGYSCCVPAQMNQEHQVEGSCLVPRFGTVFEEQACNGLTFQSGEFLVIETVGFLEPTRSFILHTFQVYLPQRDTYSCS